MTDPTRIQGVNPALRAEPLEETQRANRAGDANNRNTTRTSGANQTSFADLLRARQGIAQTGDAPLADSNAVRFSAHAQTRLQSRRIDLQAAHLDRLQSAVNQAATKGSKDSLVLMDDMAFVVSVKNRTVVTVVDKDNLKQNVFTNIDSAVIA